jgi:hypothetical protein
MTAVPAALQNDLVLLLSLLIAPLEQGARVGAAYSAARTFISPPLRTTVFDEGMDALLLRRYVRADDTRLALAPAGALFLDSLAEYAAARANSRFVFDRLTENGWTSFAAHITALPRRYRGRRGDYAVYVVLLDREVAAVSRFGPANPGWRWERPCLYVGMTSQTPLGRFRSHQRGHKSSRYVRRFGYCLLPELFDHLNPLDRAGAAALEIDLAADLRAQGYGVMGVYAEHTSEVS